VSRTCKTFPRFRSGPESPHWPAGYPADLPFPVGNAFGNLEAAAVRWPERPAIHYYGRTISYAELHDRVLALAGGLKFLGIEAGDRVLLDMQNAPQFIIAFHAVLRADAIVVPVNPMNLTDELRYFARDSGARLAIVGDELLDRVRPLVPEALDHIISAHLRDAAPEFVQENLPEMMRMPRRELDPDCETDFDEAIAAGHVPGRITTGSDDIAVMPYSSGTTGRPKACMHRHSTVTFTAAAQARWYGLSELSVMSCFMPLFHVAGMQASMSAGLFAGAALVLMTRWDPDLIPALFTRHRVTWWSAAPTMIVDVLASASFDPACLDRLETLTGGGAPMPRAVAERLRDRYGLAFCEGYGLTESLSATHINPTDWPKPQCLGVPIFNTNAMIVDPDSLEELPLGETGEILVSGPQIMAGYWEQPGVTARTLIHKEGRRWLRTGDLGYVDTEGYYFLVDRLKRMVNVSGYKVSPSECELVLYSHPAVRECCVISAPDARRGETVKALVVRDAGHPSPVTSADITAFARSRMAAYKVPRIVEFVLDLPRSGTRKIDWRLLQDAEWNKTR